MNRPDDLEQLWKTQPIDTAVKGEEMRNIVLTKIAAFDRKIRLRNQFETVAAVLVAAFFGWIAYRETHAIERTGSLIIVAGALWIVFYIARYGASAEDPAPDQTLSGYRRALIAKYEHQIRLLRSAKWWYLMPMYIGLLTFSAGMINRLTRPLAVSDAVPALIYTIVFGGIWYLNEVYGVRKLRCLCAEAASGLEEDA